MKKNNRISTKIYKLNFYCRCGEEFEDEMHLTNKELILLNKIKEWLCYPDSYRWQEKLTINELDEYGDVITNGNKED